MLWKNVSLGDVLEMFDGMHTTYPQKVSKSSCNAQGNERCSPWMGFLKRIEFFECFCGLSVHDGPRGEDYATDHSPYTAKHDQNPVSGVQVKHFQQGGFGNLLVFMHMEMTSQCETTKTHSLSPHTSSSSGYCVLGNCLLNSLKSVNSYM